ncbi:MAG: hypothetical protein OEW95_07440 [Candidatus Bathyarchaeota archaeon]|nr:hypothetical protein [Candidatus Bathyarchaeota archaeon]
MPWTADWSPRFWNKYLIQHACMHACMHRGNCFSAYFLKCTCNPEKLVGLKFSS